MRSLCPTGITFAVTVLLFCGCDASSRKPAAQPKAPEITAREVDLTPGVVEFRSAKAVRTADNIVQIEVAYKFTAGSPVKTYMLDLEFPGTTVVGHKPMEGWEVKQEGVIKTGMPVADPEAKTFSVKFSEADSPDRGYKLISNVLTGDIETAPPAEK